VKRELRGWNLRTLDGGRLDCIGVLRRRTARDVQCLEKALRNLAGIAAGEIIR